MRKLKIQSLLVSKLVYLLQAVGVYIMRKPWLSSSTHCTIRLVFVGWFIRIGLFNRKDQGLKQVINSIVLFSTDLNESCLHVVGQFLAFFHRHSPFIHQILLVSHENDGYTDSTQMLVQTTTLNTRLTYCTLPIKSSSLS